MKLSKAHRAALPRHAVRGKAGRLSSLPPRSGCVDLARCLWPYASLQKNTQSSAKQERGVLPKIGRQIVGQSHVLMEGHGTFLDAEVANAAAAAALDLEPI